MCPQRRASTGRRWQGTWRAHPESRTTVCFVCSFSPGVSHPISMPHMRSKKEGIKAKPPAGAERVSLGSKGEVTASYPLVTALTAHRVTLEPGVEGAEHRAREQP